MTAKFALLAMLMTMHTCSHRNLDGESSTADALPTGPRFLFGTGVSWGFWLGLGVEEKAKSFDRLSMDRIKEMGGNMTGANIAWYDIQPDETTALSDDKIWDYTDHQVQSATNRGLKIRAYIGMTPDWALPQLVKVKYGAANVRHRFPPLSPMYLESYIRESGIFNEDELKLIALEISLLKDSSGKPNPRKYEQAFERFAQAAAKRYRGKIHSYGYWNEPNGCSWMRIECKNGDQKMANAYYYWLKIAYAAIKAIDPKTLVGTAGLDYHAGNTNGYEWVEYLYQLRASDTNRPAHNRVFDAVNIHPYGKASAADEEKRILHWQALKDTREIMKKYGDSDKGLWLGEYGWNTANEDLKAANIKAVLTRLQRAEYSYVTLANYLVITDTPDASDNDHEYGLCSRDRKLGQITCDRKSWKAFQEIALGN